MKRRNKLLIGYVVFLICLFIPLIGSAEYSNDNGQIAALKSYGGKNLFVTNNANDGVVNSANAFVNFLPIVKNSKEVPVLNGGIVGQALASNASLLNWNKPTADLEIEKIIVYRITIADENGLPVPSVGTEVELAGNSTHYVDSGVKTGVTYEYAIKAVDIEGNESEVSNVVAVTTDESYDKVHNADRVVGEVTASSATLNIEHLSFHETLYEYKVLGFYTGLFDDGGISWENISEDNIYFEEVNVDLNAGFLHHFVVVPLDLNGNILGTGEIITVVAPPHAPENLQVAEVAHDFVTLQWENTNDLESIPESIVIEVYRNDPDADNPNDLNFLIDLNAGNNTFTDLNLGFGQEYIYAVKTRVGADNRSEFSDKVEVVTLLPEVTNLQAGDIGADSIEITWENVIGDPIIEAKGIVHDIYRNGKVVGEGVNGSESSFIDKDLDALTDYKYHIVTRSNNSNSNPSRTLEVTTRLHAPSNLRATNVTTDSVTLEWDDPNNREDVAYLIYRDNVKVGEVGDSVFTNSRLKSLSSYSYEVIIRIGEHESLPSSINVMTRPHAPQNLTAMATAGLVTLEWENINDLTDVTAGVVNEIYRGGELIDEVAGSEINYTDSTVIIGNMYTYMVKTRAGSDNRSIASNVVTVEVDLVIPSVTKLRASYVGIDSVEIAWNNSLAQSIIEEKQLVHDVYLVGTDEPIITVEGTGTSFRDTNLNPLTNYDYYIITRSKLDGSESVASEILEVTTRPHALENLTAIEEIVDNINTVVLEWKNPNDLSGVEEPVVTEIWRDDKYLDTVAGTEVTFTDTEVVLGMTYSYTVRIGVKDKVWSESSNGAKILVEGDLLPVANLTATNVTFSEIAIAWNNPDNITDDVEHWIYVNGALKGIVESKETSYKFTNLISGTEYAIQITTQVKINPLVYVQSSVLKEMTPKVVTNLEHTSVTGTSVSIKWINTPGNDYVRHSIYVNGDPYRHVSGETTNATFLNFNPSTTYHIYIVTELNLNGEMVSARSGDLHVTTLSVSGEVTPVKNLRSSVLSNERLFLGWTETMPVTGLVHHVYVDDKYVTTLSASGTSGVIHIPLPPSANFVFFISTNIHGDSSVPSETVQIDVSASNSNSLAADGIDITLVPDEERVVSNTENSLLDNEAGNALEQLIDKTTSRNLSLINAKEIGIANFTT